MLFSSVIFLIFLIVVYAAVLTASKVGTRAHQIWILLLSSLLFYSYWNPAFLFLLVISIMVNFLFSRLIIDEALSKDLRSLTFYLAILFNLGLIAYYKYAYFLLDLVNGLFDLNFMIQDDIFLPLGISFFTFQQIAFLVDCRKEKTKSYGLRDYALFISFFPQLIAGPIVHHKEMMPQFEDESKKLLSFENFAIGFVLLSIGLFKKLLIADNAALICDPIFLRAESAVDLYFWESWLAVLFYAFQIYFDFSGYCDMAMGIARMFGIVLPLNFFSPYKSRNIVDFWRTWHISLSRFLKDYLYIPLGGNRKGKLRRYINLMLTMLIGGLWHGASWTFVLWGALHGLYLIINHVWHYIIKRFNVIIVDPFTKKLAGLLSIALTFLAVVFAWVFFRSSSVETALKMTDAMLANNGFGTVHADLFLLSRESYIKVLEMIPGSLVTLVDHIVLIEQIFIVLVLSVIVFLFPNAVQILKDFDPVIDSTKVMRSHSKRFEILRIRFKANWIFMIVTVGLFVISVLYMSRVSPFLYFQF